MLVHKYQVPSPEFRVLGLGDQDLVKFDNGVWVSGVPRWVISTVIIQFWAPCFGFWDIAPGTRDSVFCTMWHLTDIFASFGLRVVGCVTHRICCTTASGLNYWWMPGIVHSCFCDYMFRFWWLMVGICTHSVHLSSVFDSLVATSAVCLDETYLGSPIYVPIYVQFPHVSPTIYVISPMSAHPSI
jgi:hypothetical protein